MALARVRQIDSFLKKHATDVDLRTHVEHRMKTIKTAEMPMRPERAIELAAR